MYNDVTQRNYGKARMEILQKEAQIRRAEAAYEAREAEKSPPIIKLQKSGFQRLLSWLLAGLR